MSDINGIQLLQIINMAANLSIIDNFFQLTNILLIYYTVPIVFVQTKSFITSLTAIAQSQRDKM